MKSFSGSGCTISHTVFGSAEGMQQFLRGYFAAALLAHRLPAPLLALTGSGVCPRDPAAGTHTVRTMVLHLLQSAMRCCIQIQQDLAWLPSRLVRSRSKFEGNARQLGSAVLSARLFVGDRRY
jgi:hypothetical protein